MINVLKFIIWLSPLAVASFPACLHGRVFRLLVLRLFDRFAFNFAVIAVLFLSGLCVAHFLRLFFLPLFAAMYCGLLSAI